VEPSIAARNKKQEPARRMRLWCSFVRERVGLRAAGPVDHARRRRGLTRSSSRSRPTTRGRRAGYFASDKSMAGCMCMSVRPALSGRPRPPKSPHVRIGIVLVVLFTVVLLLNGASVVRAYPLPLSSWSADYYLIGKAKPRP
jgi:hypothetical protein